MRTIYTNITFLFLCAVAVLSCGKQNCQTETQLGKEYILSKTALKDKIKGGWAGQVIGCTYGGPTEFRYLGTMIQDYIPIDWNDSVVYNYFETFPGLYDDIYMDLTFVDVIEKYGVTAPVDSFANAFANAGYMLWAANQMGRYNILQGVRPPQSGHWLNNPHADDIDFQIEADFIGLMYPGMPRSAEELANKVGHIMNYGDGYYGGLYVAALYSLAFVSDNVEYVVKEALKTIPKESDYYKCISDVIKWYETYPDDWKQTWFECERKWSFDVGSPDGIFVPYSIDAKINSAYVVIGLLYGKGDFLKSIDIATRCGQDSDCNPATVGGVIGVMKGYDHIPETYTKALTPVLDRNFAYSNLSLNKIYDLSYKHAEESILREGGKMSGDTVIIATQEPQTAAYEKAFEGHFPVKIMNINKNVSESINVTFDGIGVVLKGVAESSDNSYVAVVEVYCDEALTETLRLPVNFTKRRTEIFQKYQLPKATHRLTFKWLNPQENSRVFVSQAVVYSDSPHKTDY